MEGLINACVESFDASAVECDSCEEDENEYAAVLVKASAYLDSQAVVFAAYCDCCDRDLDCVTFDVSVSQS